MPKDTSGAVPLSKSQRTKGARLAKLAKQGGGVKYGGKCTRCGQVSNSSPTRRLHIGCPDKALYGFELAYRLRASFLKKYFGAEGRGIWLSKEDYEKYEVEIDAFLSSVRNFNTEDNQWENGYGEPINFLTREVLVEEVKSDSTEPSTEFLDHTQDTMAALAMAAAEDLKADLEAV